MAKLEKLRQVLEQADQGSVLILDTAESTFPSQLSAVKNFASGVLESSALTFVKSGNQEILDTSQAGQITVVGKSQLFDFPKVELTLVFTEPGGKLDMDATVKILPEDKVKLPSISDFFHRFLEEEMVASMPDQLLTLPALSVNAMTIEIGPKPSANSRKKTIKELSFDLRANANVNWELVPGFLATKNNQLQLTFKHLTDANKRRVSGMVKSTLKVGEAAFDFQLDKHPLGNKWVIQGSLAEGNKLPVSDFVSKFLNAFSIPPDLPVFEMDTAEFTYDMLTKNLTFNSGSSEGMTIVSGYGMNNLGIGMIRQPGASPTAPTMNSAAMTGTITVDDIDLNLKAEFEPKGTGGGKQMIFQGTGATEEGIPIGKLISSLAAFGEIEVPPSLDGATMHSLRADYQVGKQLSFGFVISMETEVKSFDTHITLKLVKKDAGGFDKSFEGLLVMGEKDQAGDPLEFELLLTNDGSSSSMYATLRPGQLGVLSLSNLFKKVIDDPHGIVPDVSVSLVNVYVALKKAKVEVKPDVNDEGQVTANATAKGTLLFGAEVGVDMTFGGGIPLVGPMLNGQHIGVRTVLFSYATGSFTIKDLRNINVRLPKGKPKLPELDLKGGIGMSFSMSFGKLQQYLSLPMAEQKPASSPGSQPPAPSKPEKEGKWFAVNKRMGPLSIHQVGVNFKDSVLSLGLEASLALGPLTLVLEEMTLGSRIDRFEPAFTLRGFGLGWKSGPVEISGFFLRKIVEVNGQEVENFVGAALIKTPTVTLKAIGEFAMVAGNPSFYLYAYLGYPIGGPAFFFVEGLAAGFGFNRSVAIPSIDKVKPFPLVAIAIGKEPFLGVARRMADGNYVPIDMGKLFLAVGVRFTTFKQLDSFLLLIASFGNGFRLDLLGLSKLTVPSAGPGVRNPHPLAEIELAIKGTFAPDEGFVGVQAQLTRNSYILSRDCYLTGGFAFFTWFGNNPNAGDFVISIGGYHPKFKRPAHYPVVPRLGFNWQVSSTINVKGGMYFALTPSVVMAGGRLEATFRSGGLKAWFIIGADFIIGWKPYFYDARMYLNLGVSYTFWFFGKQTLSFDLGADLHIWGPEFSGTAYVDLGIIDFTVEFGAGASQKVKPIRYAEFKKSFIPESNVATVAVASGLLKEVEFENQTVWVINPKDFVMQTDSAVPSKSTIDLKKVTYAGETIYMESTNELFQYAANQENWDPDMALPFPLTENRSLADIKIDGIPATEFSTSIGIGTVGVQEHHLATHHSVKITKGDDVFTPEFIYQPLRKSYPSALWGSKLIPDKNDKSRVIKNLLSGLKVKPKPPSEPDQMGFLDQDKFKFQTLVIEKAFSIATEMTFVESDDEVSVAEENEKRSEILQALGFSEEDFEIGGESDFGFAKDPLVGSYSTFVEPTA